MFPVVVIFANRVAMIEFYAQVQLLQNIMWIFILAIIILIYIYAKYKLTYWTRRGVKQLRKTNMIFGDFKNGILFRSSPGYHLGKIYRESPTDVPFIGFYIFHKPCLLIKDPKTIKHILTSDFKNFSDRHFAGSQQKDSIGMVNLFGIKNPAWKYLRKKIAATLSRGKLRKMLPLMLETGKPMMDHLKQNCVGVSEDIDIQDLNHKFTADLIANIALGTKTDTFNNPNSDYAKSLTSFFHGFKRKIALVTIFLMPELVEIIGSSLLYNAVFVRQIFWKAVELREKNGNQRGDFIDSIIQLKNKDQNPLYIFEGENLLYQSGIFFSGFESSSTVTAFTLMELARNKQYQERARQDIKNAIEIYGWTFKAFSKMKYLEKCIAEGTRLYPPIATIDRYTLQDYKIPETDIVIEKGTPIFISLCGLHCDPKFFDEPERFNPDRFNDSKNISDAYMPFGAGPRKCIGINAGILHIKVVLSMILSEYEIHQKQDQKNTLDSRSALSVAANGIHIEFKQINKA